MRVDEIPLFVVGVCEEIAIERLRSLCVGMLSLEDWVRWGLAREPRVMVEEVVVQDEYSHDVVFPFGEYTIVLDTT